MDAPSNSSLKRHEMPHTRVLVVNPGDPTYTGHSSIELRELLEHLAGTGTSGQVLTTRGPGCAPHWTAPLALGDDPVAIDQGGTGETTAQDAFNALLPFQAFGDMLYGGLAGVATVLMGNATTQRKFLKSAGNNTTPSDPSWEALTADDIPQLGLSIIQSKTSLASVTPTAGAMAFNLSTHNYQLGTLVGNATTTLSLTGNATCQHFTIFLRQDGTGSGLVTWWSNILWPSGTLPTLTTTAGAVDAFSFLYYPGGQYWPTSIVQNLLLPPS